MKKTVALILALLLAAVSFVSLASCGTASSSKVKVIDLPLTVEEYAYAVSKGNSDLLAQLNAFLTKIQTNGKFDEIVNKYYGDGTPTAVKSAATMKNDGSQLIVATNAAFEPFEYLVGENYYGIDMEIMDLFAKELGKELYINNMEFDAVCLSVSSSGGTYTDENGREVSVAGGVCDVAAAGLTVTEVRKEILDFSTSYYNAAQVLIVPESDTTFDKCVTPADVTTILDTFDKSVKVGVQNGTTGYFYCIGDEDWGFEGYKFETVGYANGALAVQNILNGNVKYVIIDEGPAKAITKNVNASN